MIILNATDYLGGVVVVMHLVMDTAYPSSNGYFTQDNALCVTK